MQALRTLAFLGIFFSHTDFFINWAGLGVSVFFVMSGFFMYYRYSDSDFDLQPKKCLSFSIGKIKKLYLLHIITMLCMALRETIGIIYKGKKIDAIIKLIVKIVLNITLFQTWFPDDRINCCLNGVAWFLSVTMFLYFCFPYILKFVKRHKSSALIVICIVILISEFILSGLAGIIFGYDSHTFSWFTYCFPVFRIGDFFAGVCLGKLFIETFDCKMENSIANICEVIATVITVIGVTWIRSNSDNLILQAVRNRTTLYIPIAVIWVYLFAVNKGFITKIFTNRLFIFIGNISAYTFLIHYVIAMYTYYFMTLKNINVTGVTRFVLVFVELAVCILLSVLYGKINIYFNSRKEKVCEIEN